MRNQDILIDFFKTNTQMQFFQITRRDWKMNAVHYDLVCPEQQANTLDRQFGHVMLQARWGESFA